MLPEMRKRVARRKGLLPNVAVREELPSLARGVANQNHIRAVAPSLRERVAEGRVSAGFAENRIDSSPPPRFAHPLPEEGEGPCPKMILVGNSSCQGGESPRTATFGNNP